MKATASKRKPGYSRPNRDQERCDWNGSQPIRPPAAHDDFNFSSPTDGAESTGTHVALDAGEVIIAKGADDDVRADLIVATNLNRAEPAAAAVVIRKTRHERRRSIATLDRTCRSHRRRRHSSRSSCSTATGAGGRFHRRGATEVGGRGRPCDQQADCGQCDLFHLKSLSRNLGEKARSENPQAPAPMPMLYSKNRQMAVPRGHSCRQTDAKSKRPRAMAGAFQISRSSDIDQ